MAAPANPLSRYRFGGAPIDPSLLADPSLLGEDIGTDSIAPEGGGEIPRGASQSIYGSGATGVNSGRYAGNVSSTGIPTLDTNTDNDIHNLPFADKARIAAGGEQINNEALAQLAHYDERQGKYEGLSDEALAELKRTPGYTDNEASQINKDFSKNRTSDADLDKQFLTDGERADIRGNANEAKEAAYRGTDAQGKVLGDYEANLGSQVQSFGAGTNQAVGGLKYGLGQAVDKYGNKLGDAVDSLGSKLDASQSKFGKLDAAVNDAGLDFDPNGTQKQLSDADVAAMKTAAGVRVGNKYRSAVDDLQRRAAAAGNTSPLAIGAARARLERQSAADAGDAEASADIAARQAQYDRAHGIEAQRLGAEQSQAGMRAGAATTEQKQAQDAAALAGTTGVNAAKDFGQADLNAASLAGTQDIAAQEKIGQANIDAANASGQTAIKTLGDMTDRQVGATQTADAAAATRAAAAASNRQGVQQGVSNTQYQQGMATDTATAGGAKTVGDARQAGQGAYRAGLAGQQGAAQQGGQKAVDQQNQAYSTQTGGQNSATKTASDYELGSDAQGGISQLGKSLTSLAGAGINAVARHADGYVATEPEIATIGEAGPEAIVPLGGKYRGGAHDLVSTDSVDPTPAPTAEPGLISKLRAAANGTNDAVDNGATFDDYGMDMYASGKIVTRPTTAIIGESGPEAVVPLNGKADNKVSGAMLPSPGHGMPTGGIRSRYRHTSAPNAIARTSPIKGALPLKPNNAAR